MLLLLAYPVLVTAALETGLVERLLGSEDLKVEIANPAYSIWPGKIRMKHVRISVNGTTQFVLEGADLVLNLKLFELVKRHVHVTELAAHDVLYQMRVQVKDTKGIEKRVAAYPPLKELPGVNDIREPTAAATEKQGADWTVKVEGLDIAVKELWFFEYRYLGKGHLRGAFTVGPQIMEVRTAVQDLGPGELRFGADQTVATDLRGQITADIPQVNPDEHADAGFMTLVTARVNLRSDVQSLSVLGAYADDLEISQGNGPLTLDLYLDRGKLGSKSHLDFRTDAVRLKGNGYGVGSDAQLNFDAAGSSQQLPLIAFAAKSTYVSLARGNHQVTFQIHAHKEEAQLDTIQLSKATDLQTATVRMPSIVCVDLKDMPGALFPEGLPVQIKSGEAHAALDLDMDHEYWAHGPLTMSTKDLQLDVAGVQIGGNLKLASQVRFNAKLKTNMLENMAFTLRDMSMRAGSSSVAGWWMNVDSKRLTFWNHEPSRFEGTASIRARDLDPVLKALAEKDVISKLIPMFTSLNDFRAGLTIRTSGEMTDTVLSSESSIWDAAGRIYKNGKESQMAIVVGGQVVSVGIASKDGHLEIMPFAKTDWLNEHLRTFPAPVEVMKRPKP
jgi:hypothetical protein